MKINYLRNRIPKIQRYDLIFLILLASVIIVILLIVYFMGAYYIDSIESLPPEWQEALNNSTKWALLG